MFLAPSFDGIEWRLFLISNSISCKLYSKSKPATQNTTASPSIKIPKSILAFKATYAPIGAKLKAKPRTKWLNHVNLFVSGYIIKTATTIG